MTQRTLFDPTESYPDVPGDKGPETSKAAARAMRSEAAGLRTRVLESLAVMGDGTADEIAAHMGRSIMAVRPRVSELRAKGLVAWTGKKRKNDSGIAAMVWRRA